MNVYDTLRFAIEHRQPVTATYHGARRLFCPHALGTKGERRHVLVYQMATDPPARSSRTPGWRCLDVDDLREATVTPGPWQTETNAFNPQSCLDVVDLAVQAAPPRAVAAIESETDESPYA
jgi:hypothetical protein